MKKIEYPFTIRRLSKAEGGGWLVEFPDLPGCIADGETIEEMESRRTAIGEKRTEPDGTVLSTSWLPLSHFVVIVPVQSM